MSYLTTKLDMEASKLSRESSARARVSPPTPLSVGQNLTPYPHTSRTKLHALSPSVETTPPRAFCNGCANGCMHKGGGRLSRVKLPTSMLRGGGPECGVGRRRHVCESWGRAPPVIMRLARVVSDACCQGRAGVYAAVQGRDVLDDQGRLTDNVLVAGGDTGL